MGEHLARRQVVKLDSQASASEHGANRDRIQRQGQRGASVVVAQSGPAGLVVDHHELTVAVIEPVEATGHGQRLGVQADGPFNTQRLSAAVYASQVIGHAPCGANAPLCRLVGIAEADVDPGPGYQMLYCRRGALGWRQVPEACQRIVGGHPNRGVRPLRPGQGPGAIEVLHAVAARAVEPDHQSAGAG